MKRLFAAMLCLCLLAGCGRTDSTGNTCRAEEGSGDGDVPGKTEETGADAALAASLFHFRELSVGEVKQYLKDEGIWVRL